MKKLLILALRTGDRYVRVRRARQTVNANYSGIVENYDAATKTLTVKRKDKQGEFVITDTSEVLQSKTKADAVGARPPVRRSTSSS